MYFTRIVQASLDVFWQRIIVQSGLECNQWIALCHKSSICTALHWYWLMLSWHGSMLQRSFVNQKQFIHFSCLLYSVKSFGLAEMLSAFLLFKNCLIVDLTTPKTCQKVDFGFFSLILASFTCIFLDFILAVPVKSYQNQFQHLKPAPDLFMVLVKLPVSQSSN